jgi:hypothetical protein
MADNTISVTTDNDYFNSADEGHFFIRKGEVRQLPAVLTSIIENALNNGMLREATESEVEAQKRADEKEKAIREGRAQPDLGKTALDTKKLKKNVNNQNH